jgi:putative ABC transport system substrate-binding protein
MRRREFIAALVATAAWQVAAHAQQRALPVIGYLSASTPDNDGPSATELRRGLDEGGHGEGRNIEILYRYAENQFDRLPSLALDLVRRRVAVIVASGGAPALAAKAATTTIPIVFEYANDPVALGLVEKLNRPGGNLTGATLRVDSLFSKGIELLHELLPQASSVAFLTNPTNPVKLAIREVEGAARTLGLRLTIVRASNAAEMEQVFAMIAEQRIGAVLVNSDRLFVGHYKLLADLAVRHRVPALYWEREAVQAGGLMSYGANLAQSHHLVGSYVARILNGEKAGDLPVQAPSKIELVINLGAAAALGITVPRIMLARADEVIE